MVRQIIVNGSASQGRTSSNSGARFSRTPGHKRGSSQGASRGPSRGGFSGGSRGGFGGGNRRGGGKKKFNSERIDHSMFINKAKEVKEEAYLPQHTFADFAINPKILENLAKKNITTPSPIQDQAIPFALKGHDVIGIANTGTGKTAAFLLPLITKLAADKDRKEKVLILAPTRELAEQINVEFRDFAHGLWLWTALCVGGMPIGRQMSLLERGVDVVIGTPGRVADLIARRKINLDEYSSIVLDEADRMLDMGFVDEIRKILEAMPEKRQNLFFSATFPPAIKALCENFMKEPVTVSVKTRDTASRVDQDVIRVGRNDKLDILSEILERPEVKKVLIFREMKRHVDDLSDELRGRGFKALPLHGDMRNRERKQAVDGLKSGSIQILIATDVAARGIDIADITHVINYDLPSTYDTYIHRIGRTGRGEKFGVALTFV